MRGGVLLLCVLLSSPELSHAAENVFAQLGGDAFLRFSTSSNHVDFFHLEREALGKCNAFPKPASLETNIKVDENLVYVGGNSLMIPDYEKAEYKLFSCQMNHNEATGSQALDCTTSFEGKSMLFSADQAKKQLVYIESGRVMQYDDVSGDFAILSLTKDGSCSSVDTCGIRPVSLMSGNLAQYCTVGGETSSTSVFQVAGAGVDQFFVSCAGVNAFAIVRLYAGQPGGEELSGLVTTAGTIKHSLHMLSLGGTTILGVQANSTYIIYDCGSDSCSETGSGSFDDVPCVATSKAECLTDSRCGFCSETGTCHEGSSSGPCYGHCSMWSTDESVQTLPAPAPGLDLPQTQFVYISDRVVMHYVAELGTYDLYLLTINSPSLKGRCPPLSQEPIYSGRLPYKSYLATAHKDRSVMFVNPTNGHYAVWECQPFSFENHFSMAAPCSTAVSGVWPEAIGKHEIVTIGNLTLNMDHETGSLSVFGNEYRDPLHSEPDGSEDQAFGGIFTPTPLVQNYRPELKGHHLVWIGHNYVLEYNRGTAEYRTWVFDTARMTLDGPGARGQLPDHVPNRLLYMGSDRLMSVSDSQDYVVVRFDTAMLTTPSALPMSAIGRASPLSKPCQYLSCGECTADPACGWCSTKNKCMPGNLHEPCDAGPDRDCQSWMFNYCAASSCASRLLQPRCEEDSVCHWCDGSGLCQHGQGGNGTAISCDSVVNER